MSKKYEIGVAEPYFTYIKDRVKTVEGRLQKGKHAQIRKGDIVDISNNKGTDSIEVQVVDVRIFSSFKEMLEKEELKKVLPNVNSVNEGVAVYRQFYSEEKEKEFGVVAIEIERV